MKTEHYQMNEQGLDTATQAFVFEEEKASDQWNREHLDFYHGLKTKLDALPEYDVTDFGMAPRTMKLIAMRMAEKKRFAKTLIWSVCLLTSVFLMVLVGLGIINLDTLYRAILPGLLFVIPLTIITLAGFYIDSHLLFKTKKSPDSPARTLNTN